MGRPTKPRKKKNSPKDSTGLSPAEDRALPAQPAVEPPADSLDASDPDAGAAEAPMPKEGRRSAYTMITHMPGTELSDLSAEEKVRLLANAREAREAREAPGNQYSYVGGCRRINYLRGD